MSRPQSAELGNWMEWKKTCALDLCSEEARAGLVRFGEMRFRMYVEHYGRRTNVSDPRHLIPGAREAWHRFESHLAVKMTAAGKRYKDWLFARTLASDDAPVDVIQGGATLIMRDVVRDFLQKEFSKADTIPLCLPLSLRGGTPDLTLEDLLAGGSDPSDEVARREYEKIADERAALFFDGMLPADRLAVVVREIGVPASHPVVRRATGRRKSGLRAAYRSAIRAMGERLRADYPDDDMENVLRLAAMTVRRVIERALEWARQQTQYANLFLLAEEVAAHGDTTGIED